MRKNRKMSKSMSVMAGRTVQIGAVMVMAFAMVILNMLATSSCKHLEKVIRVKEGELAKLDEEKEREGGRWNSMVTSEKLETALLRHGLAMKTPRAEQVVHLRPDGRPYPGQISVAKAAERNRISSTARYTTPQLASAPRPARPRRSSRAAAPKASVRR
jgi:hypothetical protein